MGKYCLEQGCQELKEKGYDYCYTHCVDLGLIVLEDEPEAIVEDEPVAQPMKGVTVEIEADPYEGWDGSSDVPLRKMDQPEDNWQHRSLGMRCATCMWWVEKAGDNPSKLGRCRKRAPTMDGFPATYPSDWCGNHKLDESKA